MCVCVCVCACVCVCVCVHVCVCVCVCACVCVSVCVLEVKSLLLEAEKFCLHTDCPPSVLSSASTPDAWLQLACYGPAYPYTHYIHNAHTPTHPHTHTHTHTPTPTHTILQNSYINYSIQLAIYIYIAV